MSRFVLSKEADADLFEIWTYLAVELGTDFTNRVEENLFTEFERLAGNPGLGHQRPDLTDFPVLFRRAFPYQYLIIYRRRNPLEIVAILHGKRDVRGILEGRGVAKDPEQ